MSVLGGKSMAKGQSLDKIKEMAYTGALLEASEAKYPALAINALKRALELADGKSFQERYDIVEDIIEKCKEAGTPESALEILENNGQSYNMTIAVALMFESMGNPEKAAEIIEKYKTENENQDIRQKKHMGFALSRIYTKTNDSEKALANLEQTTAYGYDDKMMLKLARLQETMGKTEEAAASYEKILANTTSEKIKQTVASDKQHAEELKAQIKRFEEHPEDPTGALKLATKYMNIYNLEKAEEYAKKSLDIKYSAEARDLLIQVYLKEGKEQEAEVLILERMKLNGPDFFYTPKLEGMYIRQGRTEEAMSLWQQMEAKRNDGKAPEKKMTFKDMLQKGYFDEKNLSIKDVMKIIETQVDAVEDYEMLPADEGEKARHTKPRTRRGPRKPGEPKEDKEYPEELSATKRIAAIKKLAEEKEEKIETHMGTEDFTGYFMFVYPERRMVVLEKFWEKQRDGNLRTSYGDATYVFSMDASIGISGDETSLAKLSKKEIKAYMNGENKGVITRFTHPSKSTDKWYKKLECAVNGVLYTEEPKRAYNKKIDNGEPPKPKRAYNKKPEPEEQEFQKIEDQTSAIQAGEESIVETVSQQEEQTDLNTQEEAVQSEAEGSGEPVVEEEQVEETTVLSEDSREMETTRTNIEALEAAIEETKRQIEILNAKLKEEKKALKQDELGIIGTDDIGGAEN